MDILVPLLFMAIFYLGPALLKRYRAKLITQTTVTELPKIELMNAPLKVKKEVYMASATELQSTTVVDHTHSVPAIVGEQSAWQGKLDQNILVNGVIFAEILQPPRAYRPFVKR